MDVYCGVKMCRVSHHWRTWLRTLQWCAAPTTLPPCASTTCSPWLLARAKQSFCLMPMPGPTATCQLPTLPRKRVTQPQTAKRNGAGATAKARHLANSWGAISRVALARMRWSGGILVITKVWRKHSTRGPVQEWREPGVTSSTRWTGSDISAVPRKSPSVRSWIITTPDTPVLGCTELTATVP